MSAESGAYGDRIECALCDNVYPSFGLGHRAWLTTPTWADLRYNRVLGTVVHQQCVDWLLRNSGYLSGVDYTPIATRLLGENRDERMESNPTWSIRPKRERERHGKE